MLTPTLNNPGDLLLKLEREGYRAFHASHPTHTADHLYNFCVTALAVRDWIFISLKCTEKQQNEFNKQWYGEPLLAACADIANASKHCELRGEERLHRAILSTTEVVDFYIDNNSGVHRVHNPDHPDVSIFLSSGAVVGVSDLTAHVINFWRNFFSQEKVQVPIQNFESLSGLAP